MIISYHRLYQSSAIFSPDRRLWVAFWEPVLHLHFIMELTGDFSLMRRDKDRRLLLMLPLRLMNLFLKVWYLFWSHLSTQLLYVFSPAWFCFHRVSGTRRYTISFRKQIFWYCPKATIKVQRRMLSN